MSRSLLCRTSGVAFAAAILLTIPTSHATAQSQSAVQQRNICIGRAEASASARLSACNAIIEAGRESPSVLATAHSVRGDAFRIKSEFDQAIAEFSVSYADQNEKDHSALERAIQKGKVKAVVEAVK